MNLKEKAMESKEYGKVKTELIKLGTEFLKEYEEYTIIYKNIFSMWLDNSHRI